MGGAGHVVRHAHRLQVGVLLLVGAGQARQAALKGRAGGRQHRLRALARPVHERRREALHGARQGQRRALLHLLVAGHLRHAGGSWGKGGVSLGGKGRWAKVLGTSPGESLGRGLAKSPARS